MRSCSNFRTNSWRHSCRKIYTEVREDKLKKYPGFFQKETVVGRIFGKFFKTNPGKLSRGIPRRAHTVKGFVKKFLSDCLSEDSFEEIFERLVVRTFEIAGEIYERMLGKICG